MKGKYEGKVFAFDFDGTITSEKFHSHYYFIKKKLAPITPDNGLIVDGDTGSLKLFKSYKPLKIAEECSNYLRQNSEALRNPEQLLLKVRELVKEGAKIAIVSFNQYPVVIDVVLRKIGFTEMEIKNMNIILGFPMGKKELVGKNEHLAKLKEKLKELTGTIKNEDIILIDDDSDNCGRAKEQGYKTIRVVKDNYLDDVEKVINEPSISTKCNIMQITNLRGSGEYTNFFDSTEEEGDGIGNLGEIRDS